MDHSFFYPYILAQAQLLCLISPFHQSINLFAQLQHQTMMFAEIRSCVNTPIPSLELDQDSRPSSIAACTKKPEEDRFSGKGCFSEGRSTCFTTKYNASKRLQHFHERISIKKPKSVGITMIVCCYRYRHRRRIYIANGFLLSSTRIRLQ